MAKLLQKAVVCLCFLCLVYLLATVFNKLGALTKLSLPQDRRGLDRIVDKSLPKHTKDIPYINISLETIQTDVEIKYNYSSFRFKRPHFIDNKSEELFDKRKWNHDVLDHLQTSESYYGHVHIIRNARFVKYHYCVHKEDKSWIRKERYVKPEHWFKVLVPLTLTDGGTFQHFQDGALLRLLQILPIIRAYNATLLMHKPRDKILYEMYEQWNVRSQVIFPAPNVLYGADYLINSCIVDSLHPIVWRESRRIMGVQLELAVPIKEAYIILLTRKGCFNCGRRLINSKDVFDMLNTRYGEKVVKLFEGPKPLHYSLDVFGKARIIIGSHGGGFYNLNFAPEKTSVVEFMPTKEDGQTDIPGEQIFFKISSILNQEYWRVALPPKERKNMEVNITQLQNLLDVIDKRQLKANKYSIG